MLPQRLQGVRYSNMNTWNEGCKARCLNMESHINNIDDEDDDWRLIYKYDIPVGFPPGITSLVETPRGCHICFIILNKMQNTKGGNITNTSDFG